MAAKRTSDLIPLCHPIPISHISVELDVLGGEQKGEVAERTKEERTSTPWQGTGQGDAYPLHTPSPLAPQFQSSKQKNPASPEAVPSPAHINSLAPIPESPDFGQILVTATVSCLGQTGVEMEALTAASVAVLTVYDMCKAVDKGMQIGQLRVVRKEGGKSGTWVEGEKGE